MGLASDPSRQSFAQAFGYPCSQIERARATLAPLKSSNLRLLFPTEPARRYQQPQPT